jgi:sigma-B regulation protein RsbU (phosphoserine phosphatase)
MNSDVAVFVKSKTVFDELKKEAEKKDFTLHLNPLLGKFSKDHFVICDIENLEKEEGLQDIDRSLLYVLSGHTNEENVGFLSKYHLQHIVGHNADTYAHELISHLSKTIDGKIWGVRHYLEDDAAIKILSLSDSKFTNEMVKDALSHFDFRDYFSSPLEYIQVMANELISNSLYKGPNKRREEQGLSSPDRKSPVFLKGADLVQVTLAMDTKGVALSVQDSFGGLSYDILVQSLKRSFEEKTPMEKKDGAGLGLYLTFLHSNQFIINFREKFRTEVICIIERNKRYKNYKERIRSFHFFQEVPGEKTHD